MNALPPATDLFNRDQALRHDYLNAKPWPHVVVENGFPEDLLDAIASEIAKIDQAHIISSLDDRQIKQEASDGFGPATRTFWNLSIAKAFATSSRR